MPMVPLSLRWIGEEYPKTILLLLLVAPFFLLWTECWTISLSSYSIFLSLWFQAELAVPGRGRNSRRHSHADIFHTAAAADSFGPTADIFRTAAVADSLRPTPGICSATQESASFSAVTLFLKAVHSSMTYLASHHPNWATHTVSDLCT